jgi:hypothetical protein
MHDVNPPVRLMAAYGRERSTFCILAAMATILKVSPVGFKAGPEYGIFSASIRSRGNSR